jgi:hypothetical protein
MTSEDSSRFTAATFSSNEARRSLLRAIADLDAEVESFEIGRTSLEDLFLKAVKA